jgi:hypothetical protein
MGTGPAALSIRERTLLVLWVTPNETMVPCRTIVLSSIDGVETCFS